MRALAFVALVAILAGPLVGQAFEPPRVHAASGGGTQIGLFGFGVRGGVDVAGNGQLVAGLALDVGNIGIAQLRLRPSAEIGILSGANTYAGNVELVYRFTGDNQAVTPYAGGGVALAGHAACGSDPGCPSVWVNAVAGIEVRYRSTFNWLLEYHGMDAFRHNRFYVGLTTRRGS
jgi:hypothetical protein